VKASPFVKGDRRGISELIETQMFFLSKAQGTQRKIENYHRQKKD
jgi:hypothetical protein